MSTLPESSSLLNNEFRSSSMERIRKLLPEPEPFFINNQILFYAGYGYLNSTVKWKNLFYDVYRFLSIFSLTVTFLIQLLDVYLLLLSDLGKLAEDCCAIILTIVIVCKIHILIYKTHLIEDLQRDIINFRESRKHPEEEEIWKDASKKIYLITKSFYMMGTSCVIFWIIFPALDAPNQRLLPYPWLFPVDMYQSPYYEIIYIFQSFALFGFLVNIVSTDLGYCAHVILIIAQYDVLRRDIRTATMDPKKTRYIMKNLSHSIKIHNYILKQVEKIRTSYREAYIVQMSFTSIFIAVVIADTTLSNRGLSLKLFQRILYTASSFFDTWMLCYWGSQLQQKSMDLVQEIYETPWISMNVTAKKTLWLMMMKAQKVPKLKVVLLSFELPLFLELVKLAYNAAALLQNSS